MTALQKLLLRASEIRETLNGYGSATELLTPEQNTEVETLQREYKDTETKIRSLQIAADTSLEPATDPPLDPQRTEFDTLIRRAEFGHYLAGALGAPLEGREAEINKELGLDWNAFPIDLFRRAVTPGPTTVATNMQTVLPPVFNNSTVSFLGIPMPTVAAGDAEYPVLTSKPSVKGPFKGSESAAETTGAFTVTTIDPRRLQASFFYRRRDQARFGQLDTSLRRVLAPALQEAFDKLVLSGTNGLFGKDEQGSPKDVLAANASAAQATFVTYLSEAGYARVDGAYAATAQDVRTLVGTATYANMGTTYQTNTGVSALAQLGTVTGGVRVSAHVPAVASKKQSAIIRIGNRRDYVAPIWRGVTLIPDEITKAATGEIVITAIMLAGNRLIRAAGFRKQEFQITG